MTRRLRYRDSPSMNPPPNEKDQSQHGCHESRRDQCVTDMVAPLNHDPEMTSLHGGYTSQPGPGKVRFLLPDWVEIPAAAPLLGIKREVVDSDRLIGPLIAGMRHHDVRFSLFKRICQPIGAANHDDVGIPGSIAQGSRGGRRHRPHQHSPEASLFTVAIFDRDADPELVLAVVRPTPVDKRDMGFWNRGCTGFFHGSKKMISIPEIRGVERNFQIGLTRQQDSVHVEQTPAFKGHTIHPPLSVRTK